MPKIEFTRFEFEALMRVYNSAPPNIADDCTVGFLVDRMARILGDPCTQILPGPDGGPNEPVPADFFSNGIYS